MKALIVIFVVLLSGCVNYSSQRGYQDPRPPLMNNTPFTNFVPLNFDIEK